jgi:hypothetical protein
MDKHFFFVGYQLRECTVDHWLATLADNTNPFYFPQDKRLRSDFERILTSCEFPFFIQRQKDLLSLCNIAQLDKLPEGHRVIAFRCALLREQAQDANYEYYDDQGKIAYAPYNQALNIEEPAIETKLAGIDVLDASGVGEFTSAIHTYNMIEASELNKNGLLDDLDKAKALKELADEDMSGHGPFTIWELSVVQGILDPKTLC